MFPRFIHKNTFPKLYADFWLQPNTPNVSEQLWSKQSATNSKKEFLAFESLPVPQLLSLLVERQPPFSYGSKGISLDMTSLGISLEVFDMNGDVSSSSPFLSTCSVLDDILLCSEMLLSKSKTKHYSIF